MTRRTGSVASPATAIAAPRGNATSLPRRFGRRGTRTSARRVEVAHAAGVDEPLADPKPGEEGRGHPTSPLVQELDQVEVGSDADDQLRSLLVGEEHRDVLAGPRRRQDGVPEAEPDEPLASRRVAVRIGVDDQL